VMSAKMTVANIMILVTFMSFIMYWRAGKQETAGWAKAAKVIMNALLAIAGIAVIVLGVWGYFVPAIIRINYFYWILIFFSNKNYIKQTRKKIKWYNMKKRSTTKNNGI